MKRYTESDNGTSLFETTKTEDGKWKATMTLTVTHEDEKEAMDTLMDSVVAAAIMAAAIEAKRAKPVVATIIEDKPSN